MLGAPVVKERIVEREGYEKGGWGGRAEGVRGRGGWRAGSRGKEGMGGLE